MKMFLEPNESLLFRTGRPFDAGETDYAETIFPPTPETIQGAIRAMVAAHWDPSRSFTELFRTGSDLVKIIGNRDGYGLFRITNISLGLREEDGKDDSVERLYPVPAHILKDSNGLFRLKPDSIREVKISNMPTGMQPLVPERSYEEKISSIEGWLTEEDLHKSLTENEDLSQIKIINEEMIFKKEPRVGIGMENATKTTQDGMFYSVQMIRMNPGYGFVVDIRIADESNPALFIDDNNTQMKLRLPDKGWAIIGGEQRASSFKVLGTSTPLHRESKHAGKGLLIYLATPAPFQAGWKPDKWPDPLPAPIAAAIPRYHSIGGWKLRPENSGGNNKCMRRCVPAGSVYFFDRFVDVPPAITDYDMEIGYGITAIGEW